MSTWAIIPVKPLNRAKSRLAPVLTPEQRQQLAENMFRHVLETVRGVPQIIGTLVISRDSKALSIAREYDAKTVQETGTPELNSALTRATQVVVSWGVESLLVLPADLPLVNVDDLTDMISMGRGTPSVVIATDQHQDGTNALFMRPPGIIPYAYGPGSYQRHSTLARTAGVKVKTFFSEQMSLDIDVSGDLEMYNELAKQANQPQLFVSD
jgi:2-phospho-L-lactate/phosphoenolpyruvate guanylyltransferase